MRVQRTAAEAKHNFEVEQNTTFGSGATGFRRVASGFEPEHEPDEDSDQVVEAQELKDRAWDDWKDDNPRNGNTLKNSSGVSC